MNFLDKLERKYGKYAISNLMLYIVMGQSIVFFLSFLLGNDIFFMLHFDPGLIAKGQIWRLISFIFIPNSTSIIWFIFYVMLYYSIGLSLERTWGSFRFNLYYLSGVLFNIIGLTVTQLIFYNEPGVGSLFYISVFNQVTFYLNLSLFLAFAVLFPNMEFLIYGILPVKVKYLAAIDIVLLASSFFSGPVSTKLLIIVSLLNFLLFCYKSFSSSKPTYTQKQFRKQKKQSASLNQNKEPIKVAFHKCTVCGKTELTDPDMEFRYCSKCNGSYEYCMDHIHNHKHIE